VSRRSQLVAARQIGAAAGPLSRMHSRLSVHAFAVMAEQSAVAEPPLLQAAASRRTRRRWIKARRL